LEGERGAWVLSGMPSMRRVRAREYMEVGCGGDGVALDFGVSPAFKLPTRWRMRVQRRRRRRTRMGR
jgi:hypothetical protein